MIFKVRVASVVDITGRRLQLSYDDSNGGEGEGGDMSFLREVTCSS